MKPYPIAATRQGLKIAIIHDWLVTLGGAEKVLANIIDLFPEADIFSVVDFLPDNKREILRSKKITTTFIQKLPFAKKHFRNYLPLFPIAIQQLDLSSYDMILSSSYAVSKGVLTSGDQLHICYCHSPIRYAWDLQNEYLSETNLVHGIKSIIVRYFLYKIRIWDVVSSLAVDAFIANSYFVSRRINKLYGPQGNDYLPSC